MPTPAEIRAARDQAGLTQTQAADLIGVSRTTWARWEAPESTETRQNMPEYAWELFLHKSGISRIPFRSTHK